MLLSTNPVALLVDFWFLSRDEIFFGDYLLLSIISARGLRLKYRTYYLCGFWSGFCLIIYSLCSHFHFFHRVVIALIYNS